MSSLTRGRIVRGDAVERAEPVLRGGPSDAQRTRMAQEEVEAHRSADRVVNMALTRADAILSAARANAERVATEAAQQAAEAEQAKLAAAWVALRDAEERRAERELDRTIALARVIAERLIGRAIEVDAGVVVSLARQALTEARGARRVRLEANPADAETLRRELATAGLGGAGGVSIDVTENAALARGSLSVHTELGTLDARLHPRLERLATALRDALKPT